MAASMRKPVVVILGATGTGKTKLSLELARVFGGEIISADSMQLYKGLDIITNKASVEEQRECPHHMIDYLSPHSTNTILEYKQQALPIIDSILGRGKVPIIVGGTIYYIASLLWHSTVIDEQDVEVARNLADGPQESVKSAALKVNNHTATTDTNTETHTCSGKDKDDARDQIDQRYYNHMVTTDTNTETPSCSGKDKDDARDQIDQSRVSDSDSSDEGREVGVERSRYKGLTSSQLYQRLHEVDPDTAARLHPHNRRKITRALEVYERYGVPMSEVHRAQQLEAGDRAQSGSLRYPETCVFWLQCDLDVLDRRLDARVDTMLEQGLLTELMDFHKHYNDNRLKENIEADYTTGIFQSIGFKEFHEYLILNEEEKLTDRGKQAFDNGVVELKLATRRYARYQIKRLRRLFFKAAIAQTASVPVYGLDCTDVSQWDEKVGQPALSILGALVKGEVPPVAPLEPTVEKVQFERNVCKTCSVVCVTQHEWQKHIKSKAHKAKSKRHREEMRKLVDTLDSHVSQVSLSQHTEVGQTVETQKEQPSQVSLSQHTEASQMGETQKEQASQNSVTHDT